MFQTGTSFTFYCHEWVCFGRKGILNNFSSPTYHSFFHIVHNHFHFAEPLCLEPWDRNQGTLMIVSIKWRKRQNESGITLSSSQVLSQSTTCESSVLLHVLVVHCWIVFHCMNLPQFFFHLSVCGHLGCFYVWLKCIKLLWVFVKKSVFISLG